MDFDQYQRDAARPLPLRIKRVRENAVLPAYASQGASGLDLVACESIGLYPGPATLVGTGIAIELPEGYEAQVRPRSGLSRKGVVAVLGTIDSDYRGEVGVLLTYSGLGRYDVRPGDRIAQLVIAPVQRVQLVEVDELGETQRGSGGFGSTGVRIEESPQVRALDVYAFDASEAEASAKRVDVDRRDYHAGQQAYRAEDWNGRFAVMGALTPEERRWNELVTEGQRREAERFEAWVASGGCTLSDEEIARVRAVHRGEG